MEDDKSVLPLKGHGMKSQPKNKLLKVLIISLSLYWLLIKKSGKIGKRNGKQS